METKELFVARSQLNGKWGVFWRRPNGSLAKYRSPKCPMRATKKEAEQDFKNLGKIIIVRCHICGKKGLFRKDIDVDNSSCTISFLKCKNDRHQAQAITDTKPCMFGDECDTWCKEINQAIEKEIQL